MKENLQKHQAELTNLLQQTEDAKVEVKRPFPQEAELAEKSNRLNVLNVALNIGGKDASKDRERQRHDGKTSIKRLLRRMGVESAASASAPKKKMIWRWQFNEPEKWAYHTAVLQGIARRKRTHRQKDGAARHSQPAGVSSQDGGGRLRCPGGHDRI